MTTNKSDVLIFATRANMGAIERIAELEVKPAQSVPENAEINEICEELQEISDWFASRQKDTLHPKLFARVIEILRGTCKKTLQVEYACHADHELHQNCVIDLDRPQGCMYSAPIFGDPVKRKEDCPHWMPAQQPDSKPACNHCLQIRNKDCEEWLANLPDGIFATDTWTIARIVWNAALSSKPSAQVHGDRFAGGGKPISDGFALVPVRPTTAMLDVAVSFALMVKLSSEYNWTQYMTDVWARMVGAAMAQGDNQP